MADSKISNLTQISLFVNDNDEFVLAEDFSGETKKTDFSRIKQSIPYFFFCPIGDETTAITVGTGKYTFRIPSLCSLVGVRASLSVAGSTSGTTTIDINKNGTTILSTKLTIDAGEKTSETAATPVAFSNVNFADDDEITIDVDAITGGGTEAGLKVWMEVRGIS